MTNEAKTRAVAGIAALITDVILIGTTGVSVPLGWALWAVGLAVLPAAVPSAGTQHPPRGGKKSTRRHTAVVR
jgi:hypothetical protein